MQIEHQISGGKTITFIVADNENEADAIIDTAPENVPLVAVVEPQGKYLFPYLKIVYKGVVE